MSGRGAGSAAKKLPEFEFIETPELGRKVLSTARQLLDLGMSSGEVSALFTQAASVLAQQDDGLAEGEWLELCRTLQDQDEREIAFERLFAITTAPGGSA
jgi:hypothetical protein